MTDRNFMELLKAKWAEGKFVCVGLDTDVGKIPAPVLQQTLGGGILIRESIVAFNRAIVDGTKDIVCAYKPNAAFYEVYGAESLMALRDTIDYINMVAPDVPVILDAKRADIGNTNAGYVSSAFDYLKADAITVHPYLGREALQPFLDRKDKGIIVLCRTSNPGAREFQDLDVIAPVDSEERWGFQADNLEPVPLKLYEYLAYCISQDWNTNGNCAVVVGATYPEELAEVRKIVGDIPILIPGIGAQGGDIEKTVRAGKDSRGEGMIVNSSRGIIFASDGPDFAEAARRETLKLHNLINQYRKEK